MHDYYVKNRSGMQLHCQIRGEGMPILMIHGSGVDSAFFAQTAECLSRDYLVITYDRRGSGTSDPSPENIYTVYSQADDAADIIQNLGKPCCVFAHSAGSTYAAELVSRYPELVERLILLEPGLLDSLPDDHPEVIKIHETVRMLQQNQVPQVGDSLKKRGSDPEDFGKVRRQKTQEDIERIKKNAVIMQKYESIQVSTYKTDYESLKKKPVVIGLTGYDAKSLFGETSRRIAEILSCRIIEFPGRHNCPRDLPREFSYMVKGILEDPDVFEKITVGTTM